MNWSLKSEAQGGRNIFELYGIRKTFSSKIENRDVIKDWVFNGYSPSLFDIHLSNWYPLLELCSRNASISPDITKSSFSLHTLWSADNSSDQWLTIVFIHKLLGTRYATAPYRSGDILSHGTRMNVKNSIRSLLQGWSACCLYAAGHVDVTRLHSFPKIIKAML